jgi:hypothetical protein
MSTSFCLPEIAKIVEGLPPAADAAGRNGDYVSLKHAHKAYIVAHILQGNAAQVTITLTQASKVDGTGVKAGPASRIWVNQDCAASDALVRQADAASFQTDVALKNKIVIIEVDPAALDVAGGFDCIKAATSASNAANITEIMYYLVPLRHAGDNPPSAIVD